MRDGRSFTPRDQLGPRLLGNPPDAYFPPPMRDRNDPPRETTATLSRRVRGAPAVIGALGALALLVGCGSPQAMGEANSLIVLAADSLWEQLEDTTYAILEPTIFTTRDEKLYLATHIDSTSDQFPYRKRFRNLIVFGTPSDPDLMDVAAAEGRTFEFTPQPQVFQARDVWARGQTVTAVVLRPGHEVASWTSQLPAVLAMVDSAYREWVRNKMFVTPPDTALSEDLARRFGFSMLVPTVYDRVVRRTEAGDSMVILRNDNPDPSVLIRSILVESRPRADSLSSDLALEWRAGIDSIHYNVAQGIRTDRSAVTRFNIDGQPALEVTGIWEDEEGDFPAAGPFLVWLVDCPSRTYFVDAWLYAPNESKYEYMLQLQEILGSFRCAS